MGKWVLKSINADWRGYKSRLKAAHYTPYTTDEERLENRPDEIPLEDFKLVLKYWGDEDVQVNKYWGVIYYAFNSIKINQCFLSYFLIGKGQEKC